jgi:hypothetical protein
VKEHLKPRAYKQSKGVARILREPGSLMACLLKNEPASHPQVARLSPSKGRSRSESESEQGVRVAAGGPETE